MTKVLWHGAHLDGKLTILAGPNYSETGAENVVEFIMISDDLECHGCAVVTTEPEAIESLVGLITETYMQIVIDDMREQHEAGTYTH